MIAFSEEDRILVTGASSGLGQASAILLNSLGATVIGVGRNEENLDKTKFLCNNQEKFYSEPFDLAKDINQIPSFIKTLRQKFGKFKGLLTCAGTITVLPISQQSPSDVETIFQVNLFALYQVCRGFLDRRNNVGAGSSVVLIASTGAFRDNAGISSYAASKGAVVALCKSLACEYLPQHIRVNCISPALIPTPMTKRVYEHLDEIANSYPLGPGQPKDVANLASFLLSTASRWITGQNIAIDGGRGLL
ncbi:MAG: SDR family oxidoreductase [Desulfovibrio sp.]|nr:SDR family oxidoreductase [Desulfovibrio sp.]